MKKLGQQTCCIMARSQNIKYNTTKKFSNQINFKNYPEKERI